MEHVYNGGLTREQFLFHEIRIVARLISEGYDRDSIMEKIKTENLFQFPTERMITNITGVCFKRIDAIDSPQLVHHLAYAPSEVAKQINLYAMMRYNRVVWDFMTTVIGEKFRTQNFSYSKKDINEFFVQLQEQNDTVARWSDSTINKIRQVLNKSLVEAGFIDNPRSTVLNPVFICAELEEGIRANSDKAALAAFNCFN